MLTHAAMRLYTLKLCKITQNILALCIFSSIFLTKPTFVHIITNGEIITIVMFRLVWYFISIFTMSYYCIFYFVYISCRTPLKTHYEKTRPNPFVFIMHVKRQFARTHGFQFVLYICHLKVTFFFNVFSFSEAFRVRRTVQTRDVIDLFSFSRTLVSNEFFPATKLWL